MHQMRNVSANIFTVPVYLWLELWKFVLQIFEVQIFYDKLWNAGKYEIIW